MPNENLIQYNRTYELIIGQVNSSKGLQIIGDEKNNLGLQVSFRVKKHIDNKEKSNEASIVLYNLSEDSINYIQRPDTAVILKVGYNGANKSLFTGIVKEVDTDDRAGSTDRKTTLRCLPADSLVYKPNISKTFPANTSPRTIINYLVDQSPTLSRASFNSDVIDTKFPFGYTIEGNVRSILTDLSRDFGFNYSIDGQRVYVSDPDKYQTPNSVSRAFVMSPLTGLKNVPVYASADGKTTKDDSNRKDGVKFVGLINALVTPGTAISLKDTSITGIFRVNAIEFAGDWRSNNKWDMKCWCSKLNAQEV